MPLPICSKGGDNPEVAVPTWNNFAGSRTGPERGEGSVFHSRHAMAILTNDMFGPIPLFSPHLCDTGRFRLAADGTLYPAVFSPALHN